MNRHPAMDASSESFSSGRFTTLADYQSASESDWKVTFLKILKAKVMAGGRSKTSIQWEDSTGYGC